MFLRFNNLLSPEEVKSGFGGFGSGSKTSTLTPEMGKEDTIKFLGEDDEEAEKIDLEQKDKKDDKEAKEPKDKDEEEGDKEAKDSEEDELKEIEEELEEPDEEKLELTTPVRRSEILKKYPTLFKDFPYLEKAYYREQQFTEIFPTIPDAKEAMEKADTLDKFEKDIFTDGNTEILLEGLKAQNPKSFHKVVDNYLTVLSKVDEKAYLHVIGNTIKHTIAGMVQEARSTSNEALQNAAVILNQYVFGSSNYTPPSNLSKESSNEDDGEKAKFDRQRQEFVKEKFETAQEDLNGRVNNILKSTIEGNIDPKDSMSAYVKKNASREALESLTNLIEKDSRFKTLIDKLWENAFNKNFNRDSLDKIKSAYTSKAKTLLPAVIKQARNEALKGMGKRVNDDSKEHVEDDSKENKSPTEKRRSTSPSNSGRKITDPKDIPHGMRSIDFLMQD
jgi:hypothetical protein